MSTQRPLTAAEKERIYDVIRKNTLADGDRPCWVVIRDAYNGDEEAYLRDMARYHNIALES